MPKIANHHLSKPVSVLIAVDVVALVISVYLGAMLRFGASSSELNEHFQEFFLSACLFAITIVFSMSALGMYQSELTDRLRSIFLRLAPAFGLGFCIITMAFYLLPDFQYGRGILGIVLAISAVSVFTTRVLLSRSFKSELFESRVLFLGSGQLAKDCADLARQTTTTHRYKVMGFLPSTSQNETVVPRPLLLNPEESLLATARKHKVEEIVVAVENRRGGTPIQDLLECKMNGIRVTDSASFFEREACQIRVDSLQPSWLVFGNGFDQSFLRIFCKRAFDLIASVTLAIIALPIIVVTSILIYLEDRGPIFYKQERVGKGGRSYMVLKFRSMGINAEKPGQPQWAKTQDPRTTKVGAIIRKLRIDEIPQILNVLNGDMSFVGPRPERPFFVNQLCIDVPFYDVRHSVKPGITGMAQVRYAYGASTEDAIQKLQYDLYYVKNNSLFLDILILIDTVQVVLLGKGAR